MDIGVIGLGPDGRAVVDSLLRKTAGNVFVYDPDGRSCGRTVTECGTAAQLCERCEIVVTALGSAYDLTCLCNGIAGFVTPGQIFIDLTDTSPALAHAVANGMRRRGASYIDCGIFGREGLNGPFILFAGGNSESFARAQPVIRCFASDFHYMGPSGRGKAVRLLCRALDAQLQDCVVRTAALAGSMGIAEDYFLESLAAYEDIARPLAALGGQEPAFSVQELARDLEVAGEMAARAAALRERKRSGNPE